MVITTANLHPPTHHPKLVCPAGFISGVREVGKKKADVCVG